MIKLIASDMDGTFLDGNECVPEGSYDLVMRLRDAGIQFVASSGRRFDTLHELFEPVVDCMDFVASNGAQVMVAGELVDLEVFSHAAVKRLARVVDMFDTMHLALFDETRSSCWTTKRASSERWTRTCRTPCACSTCPRRRRAS